MPSFELDFEVYCNTCDASLCAKTVVTRTHGANAVRVDACPDCVTLSYRKGHKAGHDAGYDLGVGEAHNAAY